jgi:hypothetical protein
MSAFADSDRQPPHAPRRFGPEGDLSRCSKLGPINRSTASQEGQEFISLYRFAYQSDFVFARGFLHPA